MKSVNCTVYQISDIIDEKDIVCIGCGQVFREFTNKYREQDFIHRIVAIADNNISMHGKSVSVCGMEIPVISMEDLQKMDNVAIIITCADIEAVYMQLNEYEALKNAVCMVAYYIISETNAVEAKKCQYPESFRVTEKQCIPKKIHYCWFGEKKIPEQNLKWMDSWSKHCPDFEIIFWNEHNYDISKNRYMYEAYKAGKWAFVSDYARLDIVYEHGGIYLDTDVELLKNIDDLLYQLAFAGVEASGVINIGLGFGATPGNGCVKDLRDIYEHIDFYDRAGNANMTSQPELQRKYFAEMGYAEGEGYQILNNGMTIYPEVVLSPKCLYTGRMNITDKTYSVHHYDASWTSDSMKKRQRGRKKLYDELYRECHN